MHFFVHLFLAVFDLGDFIQQLDLWFEQTKIKYLGIDKIYVTTAMA